jgi:hypothetical protein
MAEDDVGHSPTMACVQKPAARSPRNYGDQRKLVRAIDDGPACRGQLPYRAHARNSETDVRIMGHALPNMATELIRRHRMACVPLPPRPHHPVREGPRLLGRGSCLMGSRTGKSAAQQEKPGGARSSSPSRGRRSLPQTKSSRGTERTAPELSQRHRVACAKHPSSSLIRSARDPGRA